MRRRCITCHKWACVVVPRTTRPRYCLPCYVRQINDLTRLEARRDALARRASFRAFGQETSA